MDWVCLSAGRATKKEVTDTAETRVSEAEALPPKLLNQQDVQSQWFENDLEQRILAQVTF